METPIKVSYLAALLFAVLALSILALSAGQPLSANVSHSSITGQQPRPGDYAPGRLLVQFKPTLQRSARTALLATYHVSIIDQIQGSQIEILEMVPGQELAVAADLTKHPDILFAEPDYYYHLWETVPNDPLYNQQWGLAQINAPSAWDISTGSADVVIAIIDSGIDLTHPDLADKIVSGYDFYDDDDTPNDENGHGTHVASIAAGTSNNGVGVAGVAWNAKIMPLKVGGQGNEVSGSAVLQAIYWAVANGADVINMSLGGQYASAAAQNAVTYAHNSGVIVVAAAGNAYLEGNWTSYPAAYENVIAVGATGRNDIHANYSNSGAYIDVAAPGNEILAAYPSSLGSYKILQGTSMASPHVAGLVALLRSINPTFTADQVTNILISTVVDVGVPGWDEFFGYGRIDALAAAQVANGDRPLPTPTSTWTPTATATPIPPELIKVDSVAAGLYHTCALTPAGGVKCWGQNEFGELGDGTTRTSVVPVDVVGLESGVQAVYAGGQHSCALLDDGTARCWGRNSWGQIGNGTKDTGFTPVTLPVEVASITGIQKMSLSLGHTCAITADGLGYCWGDNYYGQTGNDEANVHLLPVQVVSNVIDIAAGGRHTCAVLEGGELRCWGFNGFGQIGIGTITDMERSQQVISGISTDVSAVVAGDFHTCALTVDGGAYCWGYRAVCGIDTEIEQSTRPSPIVGFTEPVTALYANSFHTCATTNSGSLYCWGFGNEGQFGNGLRGLVSIPMVVEPWRGVKTFATGDFHSCAVIRGGVQCSGSNVYGQLGNNTPIHRNLPVQVIGLQSDVKMLAMGGAHSCVVKNDGTIHCWGGNDGGQLGAGVSEPSYSTPVQVINYAHTAIAIEAGNGHNCTITDKGSMVCWGWNGNGQMGVPPSRYPYLPITVTGLISDVVDMAVGYRHSCALNSAGGVSCWGANESYQVGDGTQEDRIAPVKAHNYTNGIQDIFVGAVHTCVILSSGGVECWGDNSGDNLGQPTENQYVSSPIPVIGLAGQAKSLAGGNTYTCALLTDGRIQCWGNNTNGQFGTGSTGRNLPPSLVQGLRSEVIQLESNDSHTCALLDDNTLQCWGDNTHGQLGDGTFDQRLTPVDVQGLTEKIIDFGLGEAHTCALTEAGAVYCWGKLSKGELGDGTTTYVTLPSDVLGMEPLAAPIPTATPTPTYTVTPTPTSTPSATNTPTSTSTATKTPNFTATATPTPTSTASATYTHTSTPTALVTPTLTATTTLTATATGLPTNTSTATPTPTSTASTNSTPTSTSTATKTPTIAPTATSTPTATATDSLTSTPTSTPVEGMIQPGTGGSVSASVGVTVSVSFLPGSVDEDVRVTIEQAANPSDIPGFQVAGQVFQITAHTLTGTSVTIFDSPFYLTVHYDSLPLGSDTPPILYFWSESEGAWIEIPTIHNPVNRTLTAVLDHLTTFAVLQRENYSIFLPALIR